MIRFKPLSGDVNILRYGGKWISSKLNNGDFDFWYVIELINMDDACGSDNEGQPTYVVELSVVAPSQVSEANIESAKRSCGWEGMTDTELALVALVDSYGIKATPWSKCGNNARQLLRDARQEASIMQSFTFGFAMDKAENRIGSTGWELVSGDFDSALHRAIASGSTEGRILGKIHGIPSEEQA